MSSKWPKVICDPVHNLIPFEDTACDKLLLSLINAKEFQRLRRIKQLGMSEMVFPGANHSRFAHSIGVMHMARIILNRLEKVMQTALTGDQRLVVLTAALLHDLGHGPFSHAFEKITGQKHERWTETVITDPATEINRLLMAHDTELPSKLVLFFDSDVEDTKKQAAGIPTYLTQVVSSQLDADRFDYLLRDCYASGTTLGTFEHTWLIQNLYLDEDLGRLYLGRKALLAAEAYVFARYRMYQSVYFHKTTRAAEVMLRLTFERFKAMIQEHTLKEVKRKHVKEAPAALYRAFSGTYTLGDHLALDDYTVSEFLKCAASSHDIILSSLANGILNRKLYKAIDVSGFDGWKVKAFERKAREQLPDQGFNVEYDFVIDTAADTPYKPYDPTSDSAPTEIYVQTPTNTIEEIGRQSQAVAVMRKYTLVRYYYPETVKTAVEAVAQTTLK